MQESGSLVPEAVGRWPERHPPRPAPCVAAPPGTGPVTTKWFMRAPTYEVVDSPEQHDGVIRRNSAARS
jgi:hypothetical protein